MVNAAKYKQLQLRIYLTYLPNMIENGMVMPTDVNFDRKRQRKVVFYGRVSTEHEAQLAALENQIQWYDDIAAKNPNWYILKKYIDEEIIYGEQ
mgnify:FL=1